MLNNIGEWISIGEGEYGLRCITGKVRISDVDDFLAVLKAIAHRYSVTIQAMDAELEIVPKRAGKEVKRVQREQYPNSSYMKD